jgi:selenophosphate synthetase-related protein
VQQQPWFAGYSGVMVNLSDIRHGRPPAGGGRCAVEREAMPREPCSTAGRGRVLRRAAGGRPQQPARAREQLAVAVMGRAQRLLTSFDARSGDLVAVDLRGRFQEPMPSGTPAPARPPNACAPIWPCCRLAEAGLARPRTSAWPA